MDLILERIIIETSCLFLATFSQVFYNGLQKPLETPHTSLLNVRSYGQCELLNGFYCSTVIIHSLLLGSGGSFPLQMSTAN